MGVVSDEERITNKEIYNFTQIPSKNLGFSKVKKISAGLSHSAFINGKCRQTIRSNIEWFISLLLVLLFFIFYK